MSRSGKGHIYTRIFRSYLLVSLIPVLCLAVLIVYFTREYSMNKVEDELVLLTQGAAGVIQRELEKDEESLQILASDESLARFLLEKEPDQDDVISLNQKFFLITGGKQQSVYLHLVTPDGSILHSTTGQTGIPDKARSFWGVLRALEGARGTVYYSGIYGSDEYGMTIALPVSYEGQVVGYAMLCLTEQAFANTLASYAAQMPLSYMITDGNHYLLLDDISEQRAMFLPLALRSIVQEGSCTGYESDVGQKLLAVEAVAGTELLVLAEVSVGLVVDSSRSLMIFVALLCLAVLVVALVTSRRLARGVVQPIQTMCQTMQQIEEGNMNARVPYLGDDELGTMARGFNLMIQQLQEQFRTNLERQDRLRIAEFKNLQAQISPHFLYNTLESIKILARLGMNEEVGLVVSKLGVLLRSGMNFKQEMIPLGDEIKVVESYIAIQQVRYEDKFTYTAHIPPELLSCMVPNLVVQPLVENAIVHGLETKMGTGELRLTGWLDAGEIYLEIYDNGGGIDPEKIQRIFREEQGSDQERDSIGLINVHRRLKLYFGEPYGLRIESEPGSYTRILLHIPKVKGSVYRVQSGDC